MNTVYSAAILTGIEWETRIRREQIISGIKLSLQRLGKRDLSKGAEYVRCPSSLVFLFFEHTCTQTHATTDAFTRMRQIELLRAIQLDNVKRWTLPVMLNQDEISK